MPWADPAFVDLTLLWTDVGAAVLAVIFLGLEFYADGGLVRRAPAVFAAILGIIAIAAWWLQDRAGIATGCSLLTAVCLVAWAARVEPIRHQFTRLLTPKVVWCAVLIASMIVSRYLATHLLAAVSQPPASESIELGDVPVQNIRAETDRGRAIPLFQFELATSTEKAEDVILAAEKYEHQLIRLAPSSGDCNCHGWVFTGGQFGIRNPDVPTILADNSYTPTEQPQDGDLAIYKSGGDITHSGIVRIADEQGLVLIESKWGPFGVFLHPPDAQPFSGICQFYRSARSGHVVVLRQSSAVDVSVTPTALKK
jgi:hypothetical protein